MPAHDAAATALTNVFFNLARHPQVWTKLRKEVLALEPVEITFENLKGLKYMQRVLTFHRYPAIGSTSRVALKDTFLPIGGGIARFRQKRRGVNSEFLYIAPTKRHIWR